MYVGAAKCPYQVLQKSVIGRTVQSCPLAGASFSGSVMSDNDDKYKEPTTKEYIDWIWDEVRGIKLNAYDILKSIEDNAETNKQMMGALHEKVVILLYLIAFLLALILWRVW